MFYALQGPISGERLQDHWSSGFIFAQTRLWVFDRTARGGSNKYPQSMFEQNNRQFLQVPAFYV